MIKFLQHYTMKIIILDIIISFLYIMAGEKLRGSDDTQ